MTPLPLDLTDIIHTELLKGQRPNDGLLHPSSHLETGLRHAQLDVAGAPRRPDSLISLIRLYTGTMWHRELVQWMIGLGIPAMYEVKLNPWLPSGWGGTADFIPWSPERGAFMLADFKTTKGEGMRFIRRDGPKEGHVLQTSAYYYALAEMGIPIVRSIAVYYLPMNDTRDGNEVIEPEEVDFEPLPYEQLEKVMHARKVDVDHYLDSLDLDKYNPHPPVGAYLTNELSEEIPREQKLKYVKQDDTFDLLLVPHWTTRFCPYEEPLCSCSQQGTTKVGYFERDFDENGYHDGWRYYARPGYEEIDPEVCPD